MGILPISRQVRPRSICQETYATPLKRGATDFSNLAFACFGCNFNKAIFTTAIDPESSVTVSLYNPRRDIWPDHFRWNDDYTLIFGITPIGRATVQRLKLNREGVVNLRMALMALGVHPAEWMIA